MNDAVPTGAQRPERGSRTPVWEQVEADVRRRLDAGAFADGVPGEHALAQEYAVSRQTVRQALRALREAGTLLAHRGRPSRVGTAITQPLGAIYSLFASVQAAGMSQRSQVMALDVVTDTAAATALTVPLQTPLVHLARLRLADEEPLALDEAWLPAHLARPLLTADFSHTALYAELDARCGITLSGGREQLRAVVLESGDARLLAMAPGSPAFLIERLGCAGGLPVEHRRSLVRADRFSVTADFASSSGYQLHLDTPATTPRGDLT